VLSLLGRLLFFFIFVFIEGFIDFVKLLGVNCVEDLMCQIFAVVDDPVPFLPSLSILHQRYIIIVDFLSRHAELHLSLVF
jgi:hypothetical protein